MALESFVKIIEDRNKLFFPHIVCILSFTFIYYFVAKQWGDKEEKENR